MRRFQIALYVITSLSHAVLALGLAAALGRAGIPHAGWLAVLGSLSLVAPIRGRLANARLDRPIPRWRLILVEELYYAHWCGAAAACPVFLAGALALALHAIFAGVSGLGARLGEAALASYAGALLVALYAVFVRRRWVRVRTIDIPVEGLGAGFEGYRIAHLSDLHIGSLWPRPRAAPWIARLRELDADLVALTGDYVATSTAFHADIVEALEAMHGRDGTFAIMGNHDYFGAGGEQLVRMLRERGVTVLRNEHTTLSRGRRVAHRRGRGRHVERDGQSRTRARGARGGRPGDRARP